MNNIVFENSGGNVDKGISMRLLRIELSNDLAWGFVVSIALLSFLMF